MSVPVMLWRSTLLSAAQSRSERNFAHKCPRDSVSATPLMRETRGLNTMPITVGHNAPSRQNVLHDVSQEKPYDVLGLVLRSTITSEVFHSSELHLIFPFQRMKSQLD